MNRCYAKTLKGDRCKNIYNHFGLVCSCHTGQSNNIELSASDIIILAKQNQLDYESIMKQIKKLKLYRKTENVMIKSINQTYFQEK